MPIQGLPYSPFPGLLSCWIAVHDLLRAQFDDFLEANSYNLWVLLRRVEIWTKPR